MSEFRMPSLGADMQFGTLMRWHVKPGDPVHRGDVVADVDTQKGAIEVEIFEDGIVDALLVEPGTKVPVGTAMATIGSGAVPEAATAAVPAAVPAAMPEAVTAAMPAGPSPPVAPAVPAAPRPARASPLARRIAEERGIDLGAIIGTGPGGAITRDDVERAAPPVPSTYAPPPERPFALEPMRQAIAAAMTRSHREIPAYHLAADVDMHHALGWLEEANRARAVEERILPAALLLKASALALHEVPELNGFWTNDAFQPAPSVHLGVAVSLRGGGLIAPAIRDADQLALAVLNERLRDLVQRARAGGLRSSEITDPTVTVTSLGDLGATVVFGLIHPPQVALIGFGRIIERPWATGGMLGVRPVVTATLTADHRVSDGQRGGRFLAILDRLLQTPENL